MTKVLADMPNKETMSSIYEAIADMSDHHLKVASSYEELEKILNERSMKMSKDYWCEFECVNCHKYFRILLKNADEVIQCPFCKVIPWGFTVSGTKKEHENEQI